VIGSASAASEGLLRARRIYEDYLSGRASRPSPEELRRRFAEFAARLEVPESGRVAAVVFGGVPCEQVTSANTIPRRKVVWLHAGGYVFGSASCYRSLAAALAESAAAEVLVVDYRRAPENRFPAALDDALAVYRELAENPEEVTLAGDSSGAGLAVATTLAARSAGLPLPGALALVSPSVDLAVSGQTIDEDTEYDPQVTRSHLRALAEQYLNGADPHSPLASPLYGDLTGLPAMLVLASGRDKLIDDALRIAYRAGEARVPVTLRVEPEAMHLWPLFHGFVPEARRAITDIASFAVLHTGSESNSCLAKETRSER
jgi:epsilon-lactone hydrolase